MTKTLLSLGIALSLAMASSLLEVPKSKPSDRVLEKFKGESIPNLSQVYVPTQKDLQDSPKAIEIQATKTPQEAIAQIENELNSTHALERINNTAMPQEERLVIGNKLKKLDELRAQVINNELLLIKEDLARLEKQHADRLRDLGIDP